MTAAPDLEIGGEDDELLVAISPEGARLTSVRVSLPEGGGREVLVAVRRGNGGASVGRVANRIAGASFELDGVRHRLDANEPPNTLHGGSAGFGRRTWTVVAHRPRGLELELVSADGDQGFPGTVRVRALFEVDGPTLRTTYVAATDAPTVVSMASHPYFLLADSVADHQVRVAAEAYLPTDDAGIPTGIEPVEGTRFDLRSPAPVDPGFDHCWVLQGSGMRPVAELTGGGLRVALATDQPGLQVYGGAGKVEGVALEAQHFPDAVHHPDWPSIVLRPGEHYRWRSEITVATV